MLNVSHRTVLEVFPYTAFPRIHPLFFPIFSESTDYKIYIKLAKIAREKSTEEP